MTNPDRIEMNPCQQQRLRHLIRAGTTAQQLVLRARIVLLAAAGWTNTTIAQRVGVCVDTVRKWRHRWWVQPGTASLGDAKRSGRPPSFTPVQVAAAKALACQPPGASGVPLSRWSCPDLAAQVVADGIAASVSTSTVRRWLGQDAIKPWQYQSWIFITDPDFAAKAARVLDLYNGVWDGKPLSANDYVISADEKTSIQARCRCHPCLPPGKARMMRVSHDYHRGGALAYLAAYDVHRAKIYGRCEATTGIAPFTALVEQVMTQDPYASADRVFWVVDNGSSHRGQKAIDRLTEQFPNAVMVHTPGARVLAQPGRGLLLHHPAKSALPQRLHRPRRDRGPSHPLRDPLQRSSQTLQVEVHHHRPSRPPGTARPTPTKPDYERCRTLSSLIPDELTNVTTKN
jgi:hypothetical protein